MKLFKKAETLDDVLARIEDILNYCIQHNSPLGYFAGLYTTVATNIEQAVKNKEFDDNERLAQLDVNFVNYYIHAMNCAFSGEEAPGHWEVAIKASKNPNYLVLEHLLICMNAHINYDLANAVRDSVTPDETIAFKPDFLKVNGILFSLFDKIQNNVSDIFHPLKWYLKFGQQLDDKVLSFVMGHMRTDAFSYTCVLALAKDEERVAENKEQMDLVVELSKSIIHHKKWYISAIIAFVRIFERGSVKRKTKKLMK
jgi:hypothetical protein